MMAWRYIVALHLLSTTRLLPMAPIMFGFGRLRRRMIEAEIQRYVEEMPQLGMTRLILMGDLVSGKEPGAGDTVELIVVQETDEPFHRRSDFWVTHLRPAVGTDFHVFTEQEFLDLQSTDPLLIRSHNYGEPLYG